MFQHWVSKRACCVFEFDIDGNRDEQAFTAEFLDFSVLRLNLSVFDSVAVLICLSRSAFLSENNVWPRPLPHYPLLFHNNSNAHASARKIHQSIHFLSRQVSWPINCRQGRRASRMCCLARPTVAEELTDRMARQFAYHGNMHGTRQMSHRWWHEQEEEMLSVKGHTARSHHSRTKRPSRHMTSTRS